MNGQQLINDYQNAMLTAATADAAGIAAAQSENSLLSQLDEMSSGRFLNPGAIASSEQADITRASLDAHFKKFQAQQMQSMSLAQLEQLRVQDQQNYQGRKVRITVNGNQSDVIELVTYDTQYGYQMHSVHKRSLTGIIDTVALDRNIVILKPTLGVRLMNSRLKHYIVYVIDPSTFQPLITVTITGK